jgi:predicted nucleotidyltransferase
LDNGKNASDAVDFKMYELRNYVKLALQNNPNILELLFTNQATDVSDL